MIWWRSVQKGDEREQEQDSDGRMQLITRQYRGQQTQKKLKKKVTETMKMPTYVMNSSSSEMCSIVSSEAVPSQSIKKGGKPWTTRLKLVSSCFQRAEGSGKHEDAQCQRKDELETYIICAELMVDGTVNSKQTMDNAETDITFPLSNRCRAIDARESELEAPLRNLILFSRHLTETPHP